MNASNAVAVLAADTDIFDAQVRRMVEWHFSPATGSPFWLSRKDSLPFDPIADVSSAADLLRFPDVSDDLRVVPARDLIPRGLIDRSFQVYESGGTSGAPKRIVDHAYRTRLLTWAMRRLVAQGVTEPAHWLHLGPSGPHVFGFDCARYAAFGNGTFYTVDFDPRWVKRLVAAGESDAVRSYVAHLLDQTREVLLTQPVRVLSTTPPLIEAICARPELHELVLDKIKTIIWAGTSFSRESLRQVHENFFPGVNIIGIYGNTLMGVAPQRPQATGDTHRCVFEPYPDSVALELVDDDGNPVPYGERGRVRMHLVTDEMFLPNVLERDTAIRVEPIAGASVDGLADVQTLKAIGGTELIEGVY